MLDVTELIRIPDEELEWSYARSGGPGGQNVNKVASKAVLRWKAAGTVAAIPEPAKARMRAQNPYAIGLCAFRYSRYPSLDSPMTELSSTTMTVPAEHSGKRLDQFLAASMDDVSRARVQELILEHKVLLDGAPAKASLKLRGGEEVTVFGTAERPPLRAIAENIPLDIVYEDDDFAIINKPAGMMVHAGAGGTEDQRNRGTLVNALLHHFQQLSSVGGEMRPGIVHRLDKETSGLIVVAKNDQAHRKLA